MVSMDFSRILNYGPLLNCVNKVYGLTGEEISRIWGAARRARGPLSAARLYSRAYLPLTMCIDYVGGNVPRPERRRWRDEKRNISRLKVGILEDILLKSRFTEEKRRLVRIRLKALEAALKGAGYLPVSMHFRFSSRAMIGRPPLPFMLLFEGGTAVDPVLEVPYIPGSSFKGLLRMIYEKMGETLPGCISDIGEVSLFGSKEWGKGAVVLTDAYPDPGVGDMLLLDGEVTTPIYAGGTPTPRIEEHKARPVPSQYPVVRRGVAFVEVMGVRHEGFKEMCGEGLERLFKSYFALAAGVGIGRKVSLGYGEMVVVR